MLLCSIHHKTVSDKRSMKSNNLTTHLQTVSHMSACTTLTGRKHSR